MTSVTFCSSESHDPYVNLAMEETLLQHVSENEFILFFYVNKPSIIIGRYQNPWLECRVDLLEEAGIHLCRRISGGGTVYHDEGNLNFSFIMDRKLYDQKRQFGIIMQALEQLGIASNIAQKSNIETGGLKFSGNAFCLKKEGAIHHGTLLVNSNLEHIGQMLKPVPFPIHSKGIPSNPARVVNLQDIDPSITHQVLKLTIAEQISKDYGPGTDVIPFQPEEELVRRYKREQWIFGESPSFDIELPDEEVHFTVEKGKIEAISSRNASHRFEGLIGQAFTKEVFREQFMHKGIH